MVRSWQVPGSLLEPGHDLTSLRLGGSLALPVGLLPTTLIGTAPLSPLNPEH